MPTSITVPSSTNTGTNSSSFPATGNAGCIAIEKDANGEIDEWCWHPGTGAWLSTQKFLTGISVSTSGLLGVILTNLSGSVSNSYLLSGGAIYPKCWIDKAVLMLMVEGVGLPSVSKYTSTVNEIRGTDTNKLTLNNFNTLNYTKGQWVTVTQNIQQVFNSPLIDWNVTIQKSGLDVLNLHYNFGLQYRLIR